MKKTKVKIPAKLNLSLDVVSKGEKFHDLKSLVCSINLYDEITIIKRKDKKITLKEKGISAGCEKEKNNAVKTAKLILDRYADFGVDIRIKKGIPVGAGLGGSSADIAGVLIGYDMLLGGTLDLYSLAKELGSDVNYMLGGGYAVISGKGDDVEYIESDKKLYFILLVEDKIVSAKDCFNVFDKQNKTYDNKTEVVVNYLKEGSDKFFKNLSNHLYSSAVELLPKIEQNYELLKNYGAATMSGSGSCVAGVYNTKSERDRVARILKKQKVKIIIAETI